MKNWVSGLKSPACRLNHTTILAIIAYSCGQTPVAGQSLPAVQTWQEQAAAPAQILSRVKWTPVADTLPNRKGGFFDKGTEYTGVPYSSVRSEGRYIGFDIAGAELFWPPSRIRVACSTPRT